MRDLFIGGTGVMVGGFAGVAGTLALEGLIAAAVAATLLLTAAPSPAPAPVASGPVAAAPRAPKAAAKGELQLMTMAAVQPLVDGVPMPFDAMQGYLAELPEGTHRVQILDMLARPVATQDVEIVAGQRSQLRWASKTLTDLGRVPRLDGAAVASRPVAPVAPQAVVVADVEAEVARAEREIDRAMAEVDAAIAEVEGRRNAVEAVAEGILAIGSGDGLQIPKLGKRLGRVR